MRSPNEVIWVKNDWGGPHAEDETRIFSSRLENKSENLRRCCRVILQIARF